jgi:hypothetical protein
MVTRTEYIEDLSAQMVSWNTQIDVLKDKAESASPEKKHEYSGLISALQFKMDEAAVKLQGISAAGDVEWGDVKTGTDRIWGEVRTILQDTITKIR